MSSDDLHQTLCKIRKSQHHAKDQSISLTVVVVKEYSCSVRISRYALSVVELVSSKVHLDETVNTDESKTSSVKSTRGLLRE